jgi:hypothetical protein
VKGWKWAGAPGFKSVSSSPLVFIIWIVLQWQYYCRPPVGRGFCFLRSVSTIMRSQKMVARGQSRAVVTRSTKAFCELDRKIAPSRPERDALMQRAHHPETASHVDEWLLSCGLQPHH